MKSSRRVGATKSVQPMLVQEITKYTVIVAVVLTNFGGIGKNLLSVNEIGITTKNGVDEVRAMRADLKAEMKELANEMTAKIGRIEQRVLEHDKRLSEIELNNKSQLARKPVK